MGLKILGVFRDNFRFHFSSEVLQTPEGISALLTTSPTRPCHAAGIAIVPSFSIPVIFHMEAAFSRAPLLPPCLDNSSSL